MIIPRFTTKYIKKAPGASDFSKVPGAILRLDTLMLAHESIFYANYAFFSAIAACAAVNKMRKLLPLFFVSHQLNTP